MAILEEAFQLAAQAEREIPRAQNLDALNSFRVKYLGRNSRLNQLFDQIRNESSANKRAYGKELNRVKREIESRIEARHKDLTGSLITRQLGQQIDVTLPGFGPERGSRHPIGLVMEEMTAILEGMGFWVEEGPDAETDFHNFTALNILPDHPARDMHATFYLDSGLLLRTHTSPVQIRAMSKLKPPLRVICPGRVYRCDADVSHSPMFHQVEGFMVDQHITFAHLKGVLMEFLQTFFGKEVKVRFRPSYFPFTEPSAEVDISCRICAGEGCPACKQSGWMEVLGSGMIHPQVLVNVGYDPEQVTGFAFGMGVERLTMLKYKIDHIRMFYEGDLRFLKQF